MRAIRALPLLLVFAAAPLFAQAPVVYRVSFPAPEHHYAEVEVTFPGVPAETMELRMSRSSPGRYALHEYAKNVFDVRVYDGQGRPLRAMRPNPYQWNVSGHDGVVRVTYKVFGNLVDGTYLGIDSSHAHMNMPATLMWARRFDARPVRVSFTPPPGSGWKVATQLFETADPWTFTAPNFQYLMDSPTELSDFSLRTFKVANSDGKAFTIRAAVHHDATDADVDEYMAGVEKIVREQGAVFGEYPEFDGGTYTFLADYLPWGGGDGMEHRNSTVVAANTSIRGNARRVLGTVSHEFFHAWNVERIRPATLEPFNFEEANMSGELWLAEGFTTYYGNLIMARAGLTSPEQAMRSAANSALEVAVSPAHRFRSLVEMSELAPFSDAARSVDPTNFSYAFINYYPYGAAIALALDLELRQRSGGRVSLDDYMKAMWRVHGKPGGAAPGLVAKPYTLQDARDRLAEVSQDRRYADEFFSRFIEGREVPDYRALLAAAGLIVRKRNAGSGWTGAQIDGTGRVTELVAWGTPAFDAGLEEGDVITSVGGKPYQSFTSRKPGERLALTVRRPTGKTASLSLTVAEDPSLEAVPVESAGQALTGAHEAFRQQWLSSRALQEAGAGRR
jgi:predicted metalloprotease with PDZ domain